MVKGGKSKNHDPGEYQIQSIDPMTANTDRTVGFHEPNAPEPNAMDKIIRGLGELWDKAPQGIADGVGGGLEGAGEAIGKAGKALGLKKDSPHSLLSLSPEDYARMKEVEKNMGSSRFQYENVDPETVGPDHEIGFQPPKTAMGRIYKGVDKALSRAKEALRSEEMKKGVEFGFRAAREVQKYVHDKTFKNAAKNIALSKTLPDNAVAANLAVTLALLGEQGLDAYLGKYREMGEDLAQRIKAIKKDVWENSKP